MTPIKTPSTNLVLGAPKDWDQRSNGTCKGLPVIATEDPRFYSFWRASWRERIAVLFGQPVRLCVVGGSHPPVRIDLGNATDACPRGNP